MPSLIGFDVREMWFSYASRWTAEQRQSLLRADLDKPLSVDRVIWPSIFIADFSLADMEWWEVQNALPIPVEFRTIEGLWNDRAAMLSQIERQWPSNQPAWAIAITLEATTGMNSPLNWASPPMTHEQVVGTTDAAWPLLGYDVAEPGLWSALAVSTDGDQPAWAERLNPYHLFPALNDARAFAADAVQRRPERAPLEVFGIYRIEETRD